MENLVESILLLTTTRDRFSAPSQLKGTVSKKMLLIICGFRDHMENFTFGWVRLGFCQVSKLPSRIFTWIDAREAAG